MLWKYEWDLDFLGKLDIFKVGSGLWEIGFIWSACCLERCLLGVGNLWIVRSSVQSEHMLLQVPCQHPQWRLCTWYQCCYLLVHSICSAVSALSPVTFLSHCCRLWSLQKTCLLFIAIRHRAGERAVGRASMWLTFWKGFSTSVQLTFQLGMAGELLGLS